MTVQELLTRLRPAWLRRLSYDLARGAGVREGFTIQLEHFYEALEQAVVTGDPSWLDAIIIAWANSATSSDLESGPQAVSTLFTRMINLTFEAAREALSDSETLDLMTTVTPLFAYGLDKAARLEMEKRVEYVTDQLNDMQQQLERLDRSKSSFISVAAHELKTPLTLIEGYTSMMRDMARQSEHNGGMDDLILGVNSGIRRLREIVDDMIDVSLIDNKMMALTFQPNWLGHLLGLLKSELSEAINARNQVMEIQPFEGSEQMIFADPERLFQAFRNVLANAIKYTPDGGRITVGGRTLPGFIEVTISDTGIGISPEDQTAIFEKFGQLGKASLHSSGKTKFKGGGPGLGLPIARGILEAHGGAIWAESEGHDEVRCPGSIFHILLPIRSEATDPRLIKLFGADKKSE